MHMDFLRLQNEQSLWAQQNFPKQEAHQMFMGLVEEVGELAHAHLKQEQGIRGTAEEHEAAARDAVGDIAIYLASYCTLRGFSFQECVERAWNEVKARNWKTNPKNGANAAS